MTNQAQYHCVKCGYNYIKPEGLAQCISCGVIFTNLIKHGHIEIKSSKIQKYIAESDGHDINEYHRREDEAIDRGFRMKENFRR